jgi:hypothetical protein
MSANIKTSERRNRANWKADKFSLAEDSGVSMKCHRL